MGGCSSLHLSELAPGRKRLKTTGVDHMVLVQSAQSVEMMLSGKDHESLQSVCQTRLLVSQGMITGKVVEHKPRIGKKGNRNTTVYIGRG